MNVDRFNELLESHNVIERTLDGWNPIIDFTYPTDERSAFIAKDTNRDILVWTESGLSLLKRLLKVHNVRHKHVEQSLNAIKSRMASMDISISELARRIGVSQSYVSRVLNGKRKASSKFIAKVTRAMNLLSRTELRIK